MKLLYEVLKSDTKGILSCSVYNKKHEQLGEIFWEKKWKEYVWEQREEIIMSADCLRNIIKKIGELNGSI